MLSAIFSVDTLWWLLTILYVPACIGLIVIVLLQKGKGAGFAGAFGLGGGSDTVFGPRARQSLPVRLTYIAATTFMIIALIMSVIAGRVGKGVAPELEEVAEGEPAAVGTSSLMDRGIGTGQPGAALDTGTDSGAENDAAAESSNAQGDQAGTSGDAAATQTEASQSSESTGASQNEGGSAAGAEESNPQTP